MAKKGHKGPPKGPEDDMTTALDQKAVFDELWPMIKLAAKHGGGIDQILRKSSGIAAAKMIEALYSSRDDIKLKAAEKILDRAYGRPVERKVSLTGDIMEMSEKELDRQLKLLAKETGSEQLIEAIVTKSLENKTIQAKVVDSLASGTTPVTEFEDDE